MTFSFVKIKNSVFTYAIHCSQRAFLLGNHHLLSLRLFTVHVHQENFEGIGLGDNGGEGYFYSLLTLL